MATEEEVRELKRAYLAEIDSWKSKFQGVSSELMTIKESAKQESVPAPIVSEEACSSTVQKLLVTCDDAVKGLSAMKNKWGTCLDNLTDRVLQGEQYSRENNGLLNGYKSLPNIHGFDFILFIVNELNCLFPSKRGRILPIHIDDAHPLKTTSKGKTVIIKFANRWVLHDILRCQNDLKGTPFTISEHLTSHTRKVMSLAGDLVGKDNVYNFKTKVYAIHASKHYMLRNFNDIKKFENLIYPAPPLPPQTDDAEFNAHVAEVDVTNTQAPIFDYQGLYDSIQTDNMRTATPLRGRSLMRGRPSRNGRGRGFSVNGRHF